MKRKIFLSTALLILGIGFNSCVKHVSKGSQRLGKLVVFGGCGHYVVQLLDATAADSSIVTKSWTDTTTGNVYTNVFGVSDVCTFAADLVPVGAEFSFTLNGPVPEVVCFMCNIWPYLMPAATNAVTNVELAQ